MRTALIGYTGFVGSNLALQYEFTDLYNSKNITEIAGKSYDLLICAGVKAQKWVANQQPEKDLADIQALIGQLSKAEIKQFVLISTIDVYPNPVNVDEDSLIDKTNHHPYGLNRLYLEEWVANHYQDHLIIRLPGLFGKGIKKNFIHDILFPVPSLFNESFFNSLKDKMKHEDYAYIASKYPKIGINYVWDGSDEENVVSCLKRYGISSLMFTDSDDIFQFYDLSELREHITKCLEHKISCVNFVSEPVQAKELYHYLFNQVFDNHLDRFKQFYDLKTIHSDVLGGSNGYLHNKTEMFDRIKRYIEEYKK